MIAILLVSENKNVFSALATGFEQDGESEIELNLADSEEKAFDLISNRTVDLVIVDETLGGRTGVQFAEKLVSISPMTNCAIVSDKSENDFHMATEGLGILMQLPVRPKQEHAEILLRQLKSILVTMKT